MSLPDGAPQWPSGHVGRPSLPMRFWARVGASSVVALAAALVVPHLASRHPGHGPLVDGMPPVDVLVAASVIIGAVTTAAVYLAVRLDLKLPVRVALYAAAYEALVVAVKFGLAPYGLYHVNEHVAITESLFGIDDAAGATVTAVVIFALYFAVYGLLYLWARRGVTHAERATRSGRGLNRLVPTAAVVVSVLGLGAGGWVLVIATVQPAAQYLDFVFSSVVAVFTALALAGATALAAMVFRSTAQQVRALGTANLLVNVFLVGLVFLVLFHILWVVYILVVTSIWPLNTVVPK